MRSINLSTAKSKVELKDVPETMLWTLYNRAFEQRVQNPLIDDPLSLQLLEAIDYDFPGHFGKPSPPHAIRARVFDDAIKSWLKRHPTGPVISLGEGLDTQFWRIDNGRVSWISVDLEESIGLRKRFLPEETRMTMISSSALDPAWLNAVPADKPVMIVAAGLLMYFPQSRVHELLHRIADYFSAGEMLFDLIPAWFSRKTVKGLAVTRKYQAPPMPWGLNYGQYRELLAPHRSLQLKRRITITAPFPERMPFYAFISRLAWVRNNLAPWIAHLEFGHSPTSSEGSEG